MEDVENFLLEQLSKAIKDVKNEPFRSSSIFVECRRLKNMIKNWKHNDAIRRESLYYLNNIVAEWRLVLEEHNHYSPAAQIALNGLTDRLKKIRKELEAHHEGAASQKDETSKNGKSKEDDGAAQEIEASPGKEKSDEKFRGLGNPYHVDGSKIWGIDDKSKAMERLLTRKETRNKEFQAIGIVGMAGVGKTTFCKFSFNNEEVKKHFLPRIWVQMSEQPKGDEDYKKEVVKSFLRSLGFKYEVINKIGAGSSGLDEIGAGSSGLDKIGAGSSGLDKIGAGSSGLDKIGAGSSGLSLLLLALRKKLQGKRYLVVLDDIWHLDKRFKEFCYSLSEDGSGGGEEYKQRLSCGLPKGSGGCVIVTSRSESWAADMVGEKNLQRMKPLEDNTSIWNIFLDSIDEQGYWLLDKKEEEEMKEGMQKMRDEIVKRCAGLPLMAKMLGKDMVDRFLRDKGPKPAS